MPFEINRPANRAAIQTGLVLSGGGAKGAYQVGVLKALLELDVDIDSIAGASMGALNGAVLASAPSLSKGVQRLETLWRALAKESPVEGNIPSYLMLLASAGLALGGPLGGLVNLLQRLGQISGISRGQILNWLDMPLLANTPIRKLMDEYLDMTGLMHGLPIYVSIYESQGGMRDIWDCLMAEVGLMDTPPSRFVHIQSLPENQRKNVLLASAAIPLLYQAYQIDGSRYSDGGQGGWKKAQGNTPITPLIAAGCQQVIVTHLSDGALWSRHDFPDTTVLEIRPQFPIVSTGNMLEAAKAALGFDAKNIERLITQGYHDTLYCVGRVMRAMNSHQALRHSGRVLADNLRQGRSAEAELDEAMSRVR